MHKLIFPTIYISIILLFLNSTNKKTTTEEYINMWKDEAIQQMKKYKIPSSITLAQGILESSNGNSNLALKSNNHFGIKCHKTWEGERVYHDDDEKGECFRKYKNAKQSYEDHSIFLTNNKRYEILFSYDLTDYKKWAYGLKQCGYATNPKYPELLINLIEKYKLYEFDGKSKLSRRERRRLRDKAEQNEKKDNKDNVGNSIIENNYLISDNNIYYIIADEGDTKLSIAKKFNMRLWQINKYNDLVEGMELSKGNIVYIKPKRRKNKNHEYHTVQVGETIQFISQKYGIKLKYLYKRNNIELGEEPKEGFVLSLNKKKR